MGSRLSNPPSVLERKVSCNYHRWRSEFGMEYAVVRRALDGTKPGICALCYSQCQNKVIFTLYDAWCHDNLVAVNIEFNAVRDGGDDGGSYEFGAIQVREYGEKFTVSRQRSIGPELLLLSYAMGRIITHQIGLYRRGERYEIVLDSTSPGLYRLCVSCDPSIGLVVSTTHPIGYEHEKKCVDFNDFYGPPHDVMKEVNRIRSQLMKDEGSAISRSKIVVNIIHNRGNLVYNEGDSAGDGCGCIINN